MRSTWGGVYPHVCGGTQPDVLQAPSQMGLSPRVWGNLGDLAPAQQNKRSIPTCVGEPACDASVHTLTEVYPHVCGGTSISLSRFCCFMGLSPRVWGNPLVPDLAVVLPGSIPTCVGEPRGSLMRSTWARVYPHVCGGTLSSPRRGAWLLGLSPRVWGNPCVPSSSIV